MTVSTIAIDDAAHRRLARLKQEWQADSMNEVVHRLLDAAQKTPKSMFGADPGLPALTRDLRTKIWEE
jgi:predicted CopG family antitoxin